MTGLTLVAIRTAARSAAPDINAFHGLLGFLTEGSSIRPELGESEALALLGELCHTTADLASRQRARAALRLCVEPELWELGLERAGGDVLVSVFQGGTVPEVALLERRLPGELFVRRVREVAFELAGRSTAIAAACDRLDSAPAFDHTEPIEAELVTVEPTGEVPLVIAADLLLRPPGASTATQAAVLRADLLPLLFRGRIRITAGDHARELPSEVFVFLVAEQLATMTLEAIDAWTRGRPYYRRQNVGNAICGVKLTSEGAASLTLGIPSKSGGPRTPIWNFPAMDIAALAQGVVAFGRALTRSLVRRDRSQSSNLRLHAFRAQIRELSDRLRDARRNDSKINEAPETYRAFAEAQRAPASASSFGRARLRFTSRWVAAVPSIDLRATFLCGDRLVIGAGREIACLEARTGDPLWRRSCSRAVSVLTPLGLARLNPDGALDLHELEGGERVWSTRITPRVGGNASGAVVSAPGLPKMLLVSEGARHLAAIDLHSGEIKWRFAARRAGAFRIRRAGRLAIVACGDAALSALDVLTGEVVWRFCDRLRFASPVALDHEALFAMAGDGALVGRGGTRLHQIDPWSGEVRWSVDLPEFASPVGAPLVGPETVVVSTYGRRGTGLYGFDRHTGELLFDTAVAGSAASCLIVDGTVVVNSEGGELVGVDAQNGTTRYRHVFGGGAEGDRPRRLEPVLRSGALFVPQSEVHVVRPHDGTLLGRVPNDIIPDLLRVDERCDVYVAEESGHVAAYSAGTKLTLVAVN